MGVFWLIIVVMLLLGMAFILIPLAKKNSNQAVADLQSAITQEKLALLKQELARGEISKTEYQRLAKELSEENASCTAVKSDGSRNFILAGSLGLAFIVLSLVLYYHWGALPDVEKTVYVMQRTQQIKQEIASTGSADEIIKQLQQKVAMHPDARGFYLLGRLYFSNGQFSEALVYYQKAIQLKPNDPQTLTAIAESEFFQNNRKLSANAKNNLKHVLKEYPNYINAINLLAVNAYVNKDYQQAVEYWEKIVSMLPPDSQEERQLLDLINKAKSHLVTTQVQQVSLSVQVSLAKNLATQVQPGDYLLVYAKRANSPMPVAVVKQRIDSLPLTVTLDQTTNMLPNTSLNDAKQVVITARISKSGMATPQAGDLIGHSAIINLVKTHDTISIVINQQV